MNSRLETPMTLVEPRGARDAHPHLSVQFLSFSCSFQQKYFQIMFFCPKLRGWRPPRSGESWIRHWITFSSLLPRLWKACAGILVRLFPLRLRNLRLSSPTHISARIDASSLLVRSRVKSPARSEKACDSTRVILLSPRSSEDSWRKCRNNLLLSSAISLVSRFTYHKEEKSYFAC